LDLPIPSENFAGRCNESFGDRQTNETLKRFYAGITGWGAHADGVLVSASSSKQAPQQTVQFVTEKLMIPRQPASLLSELLML
jgi:hypothetical protein